MVKIVLTVLKYSGKLVDAICKHWFYLPVYFWFCDIATAVCFPISLFAA